MVEAAQSAEEIADLLLAANIDGVALALAGSRSSAASIRSALLDATMTVAPSAAARSAVARPIPELPPRITIRSDSNWVFI